MGSDTILPSDCVICASLLVDPITLRCHETHVFCRECLLSVNQSLCPLCREPFSQYDDVWNPLASPCTNPELENLMRTIDKYRLIYYNLMTEQPIRIQLERITKLLTSITQKFNSVISDTTSVLIPINIKLIFEKFFQTATKIISETLPTRMRTILNGTRWEYLPVIVNNIDDGTTDFLHHIVKQIKHVSTKQQLPECLICYQTIPRLSERVTLLCCKQNASYCLKCLLTQVVPKCVRCQQYTYLYSTIESTFYTVQQVVYASSSKSEWFIEYYRLKYTNPLFKKCTLQHFYGTMDAFEPNSVSKSPRMRYSHVGTVIYELYEIEKEALIIDDRINDVKLLIHVLSNVSDATITE